MHQLHKAIKYNYYKSYSLAVFCVTIFIISMSTTVNIKRADNYRNMQNNI